MVQTVAATGSNSLEGSLVAGGSSSGGIYLWARKVSASITIAIDAPMNYACRVLRMKVKIPRHCLRPPAPPQPTKGGCPQ